MYFKLPSFQDPYFVIHVWFLKNLLASIQLFNRRAGEDYLKHFHDFRRKLHEGGIRDSPVDPIDEYARPDGMRDRAEFRLLVSLPSRGGELSGES